MIVTNSTNPNVYQNNLTNNSIIVYSFFSLILPQNELIAKMLKLWENEIQGRVYMAFLDSQILIDSFYLKEELKILGSKS
jgi:hypothetical protein